MKLKSVGVLIVILLSMVSCLCSYALLSMSSQFDARMQAQRASYSEVILPLRQIDANTKNLRFHLYASFMHNQEQTVSVMHTHPLSVHTEAIRTEMARNAELWQRAIHAQRDIHVRDLQTMYDTYFSDGIRPGIVAAEAHDWDGIVRAVTASLPVYIAYEKALQKRIEDLHVSQTQQFEQARAQQRGMIGAVIASLLGALLVATLIVWRTVTSYNRRLVLAVHATDAMALGDLTLELQSDGQCEAAGMLRSLVKMQQSMRTLVGTIHRSADAIHASASEVAHGNAELAKRTERQAAALEKTVSSAEDLAAAADQNARHAQQAKQMATAASEVAREGGRVIAEVVDTMASINDAAKNIVDIIGVIDGIAFQTNILALNAAVEAARAGDQGRGFAVVASEVRNLAQRSAGAAKEIKTLIGNSVSQIAAGTTLVDLAGSTMNDIVVNVGRVSDIIGQIAASSNTQTSGIVQINDNVTQMDGVVQQNVALVEEAAAAAASLQEQARMLIGAVQVFKCTAADSAGRTDGGALARLARPISLPSPAALRQ